MQNTAKHRVKYVRDVSKVEAIPAADRERIFAPFEQGGDAGQGKPEGFGVGLHEARTIARAHGGTLELHDRPGGGSEFRLTVPLRAVPAAGEALHA